MKEEIYENQWVSKYELTFIPSEDLEEGESYFPDESEINDTLYNDGTLDQSNYYEAVQESMNDDKAVFIIVVTNEDTN